MERKSLEEMNAWNYSEAWTFFTKNAIGIEIPETSEYVYSLATIPSTDLRERSKAKKILRKFIFGNTLVLIDGGSNSGKTTFAKRLANDVGASIVDIDMICKKYISENYVKVLSKHKKDFYAYYSEMDKMTDEYILQNLEKIVSEKAKSNKPVILVGKYLEVIYRSVIVKTLGRYFSQVVSILCLEKDFKTMDVLFKARCLEFGDCGFPGEYEKVKEQYLIAKNLAELDNGMWLGFGMTKSFIVDSQVSNQYK